MKCLALGLAVLLSFASLQEDTPAPATEATVESAGHDKNPLAWLEGHWIGEGLGGVVEETWLSRRGGAMVGMFRHLAGERVTFYELITIEEGTDGLQMRLKHFSEDLRGWEEKDESLVWPVEWMEEKGVRFGPVVYELNSDGTLFASVELDNNGETATEELRFRRAE